MQLSRHVINKEHFLTWKPWRLFTVVLFITVIIALNHFFQSYNNAEMTRQSVLCLSVADYTEI